MTKYQEDAILPNKSHHMTKSSRKKLTLREDADVSGTVIGTKSKVIEGNTASFVPDKIIGGDDKPSERKGDDTESVGTSSEYIAMVLIADALPFTFSALDYTSLNLSWPAHNFDNTTQVHNGQLSKHGIQEEIKNELNEDGTFLWDVDEEGFILFEGQPNPRPVIGVLSQEIGIHRKYGTPKEQFNVEDDSVGYVEGAYVKWVEASGALAMPIPLSTTTEEILDLMQNHLSGLVLPGSNRGPVTKPHFKELITASLNFTIMGKTDIPIFGICMGHQVIYEALAIAQDQSNSDKTFHSRLIDVNNTKLIRLNMRIKERKARIFAGMTDTMVESLSKDQLVLHNHSYGVTKEMVQKVDGLMAIAVAENDEGFEFVSMLEHEHLPLFSTQWHPEKPAFTFGRKRGGMFNFLHALGPIEVSQFFGNRFVDMCRKHPNRFLLKDDSLSYSLVPVLLERRWKTLVYLI